ncbi:hypothetical protein B9Z55_003607 [Caenorhabditis nigoni]|uniref:C-type lectin domain-containing protein n=1 Tax=Caenorhabditis nigoni TaxID=1611254 RepID=A0A2G5VRW2_9PELO|nr:hypothetical protein B9Z55_003607 [Caenorhabditis nigoni]
MFKKHFLLLSLFFGIVSAGFSSSSSSESCEDDHNGGGGGGHNHGGGGGGRPNGGCDAGWRRFNRPNGGWCIRSFGGRLTHASAEAQCQSYGATLSGLQNMEEARYATSSALPLMSSSSGSLWLGAHRTNACNRQRVTTECTPQNSFRWTDGSTSGTAGFLWSQAQPDNAYDLKQDCIIITAARGPLTVKNVVWPENRLDDVDCALDSTEVSPRALAGYVCGKKAR